MKKTILRDMEVDNSYYQINEERVLFSQLDEEGVLFDIEKNQYLRLNQTFTSIFLYLQQELSSKDILAKLLDEYEVEEEECKRELVAALSQLVETKFITRK